MRTVASISIILCAVAVANVGAAKEPTAIGVWQQVDDKTGEIGALVTIYERDGRFAGKITKLYLKPDDPPHPICSECKGARKGKPYLGLEIIEGAVRHGLTYSGGTILDPEDGTEYSLEMNLSTDGQRLTVHGFLGVEMLGRSQEWKRLK
jgi:uncharacterized protein (DUF2147 family)